MKQFLGHSIFSLIAAGFFILLGGPVAYGDSAGFVGLQVQGITKEVAQSIGLKSVKGVLVRDVALNGPGNLAGFQRGDLILEFNKKTIKNFGDIVVSVQKIRSGQTIPVLVSRNHGQELKLILKAGTWPASWNITKGEIGNIHELGLTMTAVTGSVRKKFGVKWGSIGVLLTVVDEATVAKLTRLMDLKPGDLILQVDQDKVWLPTQIIRKYIAAKKAKRPSLLLLIEGRTGYRFSILPIASKP
jgi:serine protease Do